MVGGRRKGGRTVNVTIAERVRGAAPPSICTWKIKEGEVTPPSSHRRLLTRAVLSPIVLERDRLTPKKPPHTGIRGAPQTRIE